MSSELAFKLLLRLLVSWEGVVAAMYLLGGGVMVPNTYEAVRKLVKG